WAIPHAGDLNREVFFLQLAEGASVLALDFFRFGNGRPQADRQIVREMVAAHRNRCRVTHDAANVTDKLGSAASDVEQAAAKLAFILGKARFGRGELLEYGVIHADTRAIN